eukprot:365837-Chlamydomonas_euryale.AAC.8
MQKRCGFSSNNGSSGAVRRRGLVKISVAGCGMSSPSLLVLPPSPPPPLLAASQLAQVPLPLVLLVPALERRTRSPLFPRGRVAGACEPFFCAPLPSAPFARAPFRSAVLSVRPLASALLSRTPFAWAVLSARRLASARCAHRLLAWVMPAAKVSTPSAPTPSAWAVPAIGPLAWEPSAHFPLACFPSDAGLLPRLVLGHAPSACMSHALEPSTHDPQAHPTPLPMRQQLACSPPALHCGE